MIRIRHLLVVLTLFASVKLAQAQPSAEQIQADLAGPYAATQAEPVIKARGEIAKRIEPLLVQQARYLLSMLKPWKQDPRGLLLTDGRHTEHGVRPNTTTANGLAIVYRVLPDEAFVPEFTREMARDKAIGILRYILPTHGAGGRVCLDGKRWKDQWQSAHWAYAAGTAAWLMWNDLDPELKWLTARMVCDEADRFLDSDPPHQLRNDTKAEENAWNAQIIALAYNMFPNHPKREQYRDAAIRWGLSAFATSKDLTSDQVVDGKPLKEWLKGLGPNMYDDYTLENHARVHPDYMCTVDMNAYQELIWRWGNPAAGADAVPQMTLFNFNNIYDSLLKLSFPDAGWIYPNAQDWQLHRNAEWFCFHVMKAVSSDDPAASRMMRLCLETYEKMAARRAPDGPVVLPHETRFASTQSMLLEWPARSYLMLLQRGEGAAPMEEAELWKSLAGRHLFETGKFAALRTERSVSSFSWGAQIMGMVLPVQRDLLLAPNDRGLIGYVDNDVPVMKDVRVIDAKLGSDAKRQPLVVSGVIQRGHRPPPQNARETPPQSTVEQHFGFVALPDGRTVYVDVLKLQSDVKPRVMNLATLGVLNDADWVHHDGSRTIYHPGGEQTFNAANAGTDSPLALKAKWLNVDQCLGVVVLASSGQQTYVPARTRASGRIEQLLHFNAIDAQSLATAKPGDVVARVALVLYPAQRAEVTAEHADLCLISGDALRPVITLDDETKISFDLEKHEVEISE